MADQLSLALRLRDEATFANFLAEPGSARAAAVSAFQAGEPFLYLWGAADTGRSHFLQAACHRCLADGGSTQYFSLAEVVDYPPDELLSDMEHRTLVCLDDLEAAARRRDWEEALFHFYNRLRDGGGRLAVAAEGPPRSLPLTLPDLQSRLATALTFHFEPYDDAAKVRLLRHRASRLGLSLGEEVAGFLVNRGDRRLSALLDTLARLDRASLKHKRRLTVPFVKEVLGW